MSETITESQGTENAQAAPVADSDVLNNLGTQVAELARAVGRVLRDADDQLKEIARMCLQARLAIPKRIASNGLWVHDWDGNTAEYRKWYEDHVLSVLQEQAPVVTFTFTRDDGENEEKAIGDTDWVQRAQRSIRYYVAEYRGDFMREHGFENEASKFPTPLDLEKPSVKAAKRYADQRAAQANPTPPTEKVADIVTGLEANRESAVLIVDMLRNVAEQLDERMTVEVIDSLNKRQSQKLSGAISAVQKITDGIIDRMAKVESGELVAQSATPTENGSNAS